MAAHKIIGHKASNSALITLSGILARLRTRKCDTGRTWGTKGQDYFLSQ